MKATALAVVTALALAGCSATPVQDDGTVHIVASTDVYGSIAEAVGGDLVTVTSLISSAAQDPHSYEASAQDRLALAHADIVIENGGGYDPFIGQLLDPAASSARLITVVEADEAVAGFNEHVWYDLDAMAGFAGQLAETLAEIDGANAARYTAAAEAFAAEISVLVERAHELASSLEGQGVALTEPVPAYLLEEVGLVNLTPEAFTEAIEEGADVPPSALRETLDVIASGRVVLLAYNSQTASAETERVREAAEAAGIPVADFTETLPDGRDYLSWMTANLDAIASALT
ncbi:MAG: zinc ABC transporter substrate-binding protein [Rhodoglobus sp.]